MIRKHICYSRLIGAILIVASSISLIGCGNNLPSSSSKIGNNRHEPGHRTRQMSEGGWVAQQTNATGSINAVQFVNAQDGWAVGAKGLVLRTSDGGRRWVGYYTSKSITLNGLHFVNDVNGWAVGNGILENSLRKMPGLFFKTMPLILETHNGGRRWIVQWKGKDLSTGMRCRYSNPNSLYGVEFSSRYGLAFGTENYTTHNRGTSWGFVNIGRRIHVSELDKGEWQYCGFHGGEFVGSSGWLVGSAYEGSLTGVGLIVHTSDKGRHWIVQTATSLMRPLNDVFFANTLDGWVVGEDGEIFVTTDGGKDWVMQSSGTFHQLNSIFFLTPLEGWVVGNAGTILGTTDGGKHWVGEKSGTVADLHSVYCVVSGCWAAGARGTVLHLRLRRT